MDEIIPEFIWMVWSSIINLALSFQANEKLEVKSDFNSPYTITATVLIDT